MQGRAMMAIRVEVKNHRPTPRSIEPYGLSFCNPTASVLAFVLCTVCDFHNTNHAAGEAERRISWRSGRKRRPKRRMDDYRLG